MSEEEIGKEERKFYEKNIEALEKEIIFDKNLIKNQQNKIASLQKEIKLMKSININDNYISKDKVLKALGYEENDEEYKRIYNKEELILSLIQTINEECDRLEDIEDRKVQVEIQNIENRRDKDWKDKIREKIEFYKRYGKIKNSEEYVMSVEINVLEELLEE